MLRMGKVIIAWTAVLFSAVDPAAACRFRCYRSCYYRPAYCCYTPCYSYCSPCGGYSSCNTCSSCDGGTATTEPPQSTYRQPTPAPTPAPRQPAAELPTPEPAPSPAPPRVPAPRQPEPAPMPAPQEMPEEPAAPELPAEEPAPAKPSDVEDLFKDTAPAPEPEAPAEPQKKADDIEDLFKDSDEKKGAAVKLPEGLDDLFGEPPTAVAEPVAAGAPVKVATPTPAAAPLAAAPVNRDGMRVWTDNTGKYRVTARLVSISKAHVRLLKDTGKYTTVSFERLSHTDLAFVFSQPPTSIARAR